MKTKDIKIFEETSSENVSYAIGCEETNGKRAVFARCWDMFLAERILRSIKDYVEGR